MKSNLYNICRYLNEKKLNRDFRTAFREKKKIVWIKSTLYCACIVLLFVKSFMQLPETGLFGLIFHSIVVPLSLTIVFIGLVNLCIPDIPETSQHAQAELKKRKKIFLRICVVAIATLCLVGGFAWKIGPVGAVMDLVSGPRSKTLLLTGIDYGQVRISGGFRRMPFLLKENYILSFTSYIDVWDDDGWDFLHCRVASNENDFVLTVLNRLRIDGMAVSPETIKADYEMGKGVIARDTGTYLELEEEQFDEPLFFEVTYYENCSVLVSVRPVTSQR